MAEKITEDYLKGITQIELANLLGVTTTTIRNWESISFEDEIGPFPQAKKDGTKKLYNFSVCRDWYTKYQCLTKYKDLLTAKKEGSLEDAKTKKEWALAAMAEMELAEAQGKVVKASEVERKWSHIVLTIRSKLLSLPGRLSMLIDPSLSVNERTAIIDNEIRTVLEELSKDEE